MYICFCIVRQSQNASLTFTALPPAAASITSAYHVQICLNLPFKKFSNQYIAYFLQSSEMKFACSFLLWILNEYSVRWLHFICSFIFIYAQCNSAHQKFKWKKFKFINTIAYLSTNIDCFVLFYIKELSNSDIYHVLFVFLNTEHMQHSISCAWMHCYYD